MLKTTILFFSALLFVGCSNEPKEKEIKTPDLEESIQEPLEELIEEEEPKQLEFNTIEDYAKLRTKEEIIETFGKENITHGSSWFAEGTVEMKHTMVINPKTKHKVKYLWSETNSKKLSSIEISYFDWNEDYEVVGTQKVLSACGFYTGMPINELRKWNGADFKFSGFGWDYEGGVFAMPKSRLSTCPVTIKLGLKMDDNINLAEGLYGDQELSTSDPNVQKAPIVIDRMYYYIDN